MNFEQDVRDEVLKWLPFDRTDLELTAELEAKPTREMLVWFFNWLSRIPHPHPRQVFRSQEYTFRRLSTREQVYLARLEDLIESGEYLAPHLSRGIISGYDGDRNPAQKKNLLRKKSLDLLLNDWGVHHLHLPDVLDSDGFVRRDRSVDEDLLLFVMFRDRQAFLLDVLPHGVWSDDRLVEIAVKNWPDARLFVELHAFGLSESCSAADKKKLRAVGVTSAIQIGDKVYMPPKGGISTAGTGAAAAIKANSLRSELLKVEKGLTDDPAYLRPQIERLGHSFPKNPNYRVLFIRTDFEWMFVVKESVTGAVFKINTLG